MRTLLVVVMMGALLFAGCSEQTQQQLGEATQSVASDAKENLERAAESTQDALETAQLTSRVKAALMASDQIATGNLNVESEDGAVHLKGSVEDESQRTLAQEIAKNTAPEGTEIINELLVGEDEVVAGTDTNADSNIEVEASPTPDSED